MALANSLALRLAGIDKKPGLIPRVEKSKRIPKQVSPPASFETKPPKNSYTGSKPNPSDHQLDMSLQRAMDHALSHGVTQVHDMGSYGGWLDLGTYQRAYAQGALKLQVSIHSFVPLRSWSKLDSFVKINGRGNDRLRWGGLKGFSWTVR